MSWGKGSGPDWKAAIVSGSIGSLLVGVGSLIAAIFVFGDPPAKQFWFPAMVVLIVVGGLLMANSSRLAERSRHGSTRVPEAMESDAKRKLRVLIAMSSGIAALTGLQLWLSFEHQDVAELVVGAVVLACMAGLFAWVRRSGLARRPPRA